MNSAAELFICGRAGVRRLVAEGERVQETFRYRLADAPELTPEQRDLMCWFDSADEVKPLADGRLLVTSVGGCAAFLETDSRRLSVFAWADGAHSAEQLPGELVAVAVSHRTGKGAPGDGHRLALYAPDRPFEELWGEEFNFAHGVVWDERREVLWALGHDELRAYRLCTGTSPGPRMVRDSSWPLPRTGGHDLQPAHGGPDLFVSAADGVLLFDREARGFRPHPILGDLPRVKSVAMHPRSGRLAVVQADGGGSAYSGHVTLHDPSARIVVPGPPAYKARWATSRYGD